jgi:hypothetical protein
MEQSESTASARVVLQTKSDFSCWWLNIGHLLVFFAGPSGCPSVISDVTDNAETGFTRVLPDAPSLDRRWVTLLVVTPP